MDIDLSPEQLPEAQKRVKQWNLGKTSYLMESCLQAQMDHPMGIGFSVDKWPEFSMIILSTTASYEFTFFSDITCFLAEDGANVEELLKKSKQLRQKDLTIGNSPIKYEPLLKEMFRQWQADILHLSIMYILAIDLDALKPCTLDDTYTVCELQECDAEFINSHWEFSEGDSSVSYVRYHIRHFPTVAVKTKSGDLVAWEITYFIGAMGMLYVMEEHRGRGLAKFIIYTLAKKLLEQGRSAYCFVESHNKASVDLHLKCGFSIFKEHELFYAKVRRNDF